MHKRQELDISSGTLYKNLCRTVANLDVLNQFNMLKNRVYQKDPEICTSLRDHGFRTARGKGWATALIDYLTTSLSISKTAFTNLNNEAAALHCLVTQFGAGVLMLLPKGDSLRLVSPFCPFHDLSLLTPPFRFSHNGIQKLREVCPYLAELVPEFRRVCELLRRHVYAPIMAGHDLAITRIKVSGKDGSLVSRLHDALNAGRGEAAFEGRVLETSEDQEMSVGE